ncbi:MAG: hypothetical protein ACRDMV_20755 [Streptosporangiales bacterium]
MASTVPAWLAEAVATFGAGCKAKLAGTYLHAIIESRDATLDRKRDPLPGSDVYRASGPFRSESGPPPRAIRVGYRSFDRQ